MYILLLTLFIYIWFTLLGYIRVDSHMCHCYLKTSIFVILQKLADEAETIYENYNYDQDLDVSICEKMTPSTTPNLFSFFDLQFHLHR